MYFYVNQYFRKIIINMINIYCIYLQGCLEKLIEYFQIYIIGFFVIILMFIIFGVSLYNKELYFFFNFKEILKRGEFNV